MIFENALLMMNFALPFEDDLNRLLTSCYKPFEALCILCAFMTFQK